MRDDEIKPLLERLLAIVETTAKDVGDIKHELSLVNTRLDGFEKRLDDQGRVLAALIPTRLATVPSSAA